MLDVDGRQRNSKYTYISLCKEEKVRKKRKGRKYSGAWKGVQKETQETINSGPL